MIKNNFYKGFKRNLNTKNHFFHKICKKVLHKMKKYVYNTTDR